MIKHSIILIQLLGIVFLFQACNSKDLHSIQPTNQEAKAWCQNLSNEDFCQLAMATKNDSPYIEEPSAFFYNPFFWDWFNIMYDICATNAEDLGYEEDDPEFYSIVQSCMGGK